MAGQGLQSALCRGPVLWAGVAVHTRDPMPWGLAGPCTALWFLVLVQIQPCSLWKGQHRGDGQVCPPPTPRQFICPWFPVPSRPVPPCCAPSLSSALPVPLPPWSLGTRRWVFPAWPWQGASLGGVCSIVPADGDPPLAAINQPGPGLAQPSLVGGGQGATQNWGREQQAPWDQCGPQFLALPSLLLPELLRRGRVVPRGSCLLGQWPQ